MSKSKNPAPGTPEGGPGGVADRGRFSARRKTDSVLRVLKGEPLDGVSRELGVTAATLATWRDAFVAAGTSGLKSRPTEPQEDQLRQLTHVIGEMSLTQHILKARLKQLEDPQSPFFRRKSSP